MGPKGSEPYVIPSHCEFQSIKGIPQLELLEKELAKKGLKDPWMRNEIWRHHPGFGTKMNRAAKLFFRGLPLGLGLTIITVALEKFAGGGAHGGHEEH
ncbi:NADH dehydrogenase [ubiquinone] 1 beta subcomplex subunit 3-like [Colias croceus]|uniref:NADH dehydrogenase [ubiquinone] 1 beta subcomplex subunit 3-like n=1 Tax=Colias crocea TaxID=72248 RepID=UPI001E27E430|nr:NADH dehydrogenase [ubiquinone] 1 beta subcomplex subunit 3-like [Colias croceus]